MGQDAEMWREFNELKKIEATIRLKDRTELVEFLAGWFGFKVVKIQEYHLRLFLPDGQLEYFPQTGRASKFNKWFMITDIEKFINKRFKPKTT